MDKLVMLKSSRYGLEIHLNPQAEFSKLLREMERKLKASIKFFEGAKMAVEFKDRLLSQAEERAKNLITDYVNRMGEATGETYEIKWK
jgi:septum site-determining protein MinC